jgi:hypothetical protein
MPSFRVVIRLALAAALIAVLVVGVGAAARSSGSSKSVAAERLPDLDQETPSELEIREQVAGGRRSYLLGFRSAVRNVGDGPLIVNGSRADTATPYMRVDQIVELADNTQTVVPGVGRMRYAISSDHRHWHFLDFERYQLQRSELRQAGTSAVLVQDQKTGFCLGDRYRVTTRAVVGAVPQPVYTGRCGLSNPDLLQVRAGISVGYGDDYSAFLEGQDLPLDGLPSGRYVLVHRVNINRGLRELTYSNNAASVLLDLHWRSGKPYLLVLARCPDTDRCDDQAAPTLSPSDGPSDHVG